MTWREGGEEEERDGVFNSRVDLREGDIGIGFQGETSDKLGLVSSTLLPLKKSRAA